MHVDNFFQSVIRLDVKFDGFYVGWLFDSSNDSVTPFYMQITVNLAYKRKFRKTKKFLFLH